LPKSRNFASLIIATSILKPTVVFRAEQLTRIGQPSTSEPNADQVRVQGFFHLPTLRIETFRFSDGGLWGESSILARRQVVAGL
jgi:hypothetical protein